MRQGISVGITAQRRMASTAGRGEDSPGELRSVRVGIDPGQRGAIVAVHRYERATEVMVWHAGGAGGWCSARIPHPSTIAGILRVAAPRWAPGADGGRSHHHVVIGLEDLGSRPAEGVASTATQAAAWGLLLAACELSGWPMRVVATREVDAALGVPSGCGRVLRKELLGRRALADLVTAGLPRVVAEELCTPIGGRAVSDGATDALAIALALEVGL
jgi:hypothetical protein